MTKQEKAWIAWAKRSGNRTDDARAKAGAMKHWRLIASWEVVREASPRWGTSLELAACLRVHQRQARRLMKYLGASGFCEYRKALIPRPAGGAPQDGIRVKR